MSNTHIVALRQGTTQMREHLQHLEIQKKHIQNPNKRNTYEGGKKMHLVINKL
jgi:hypothetical protein